MTTSPVAKGKKTTKLPTMKTTNPIIIPPTDPVIISKTTKLLTRTTKLPTMKTPPPSNNETEDTTIANGMKTFKMVQKVSLFSIKITEIPSS